MSQPDTNTVHPGQAETWPLALKAHAAMPTPALMGKELKNRWRFLWSMPVNHPDCPGNHSVRHFPPASTKVPVSTCSSDIILSLYFLWNAFDEKWIISSCQHRPKPLPGQTFFPVSLLRSGRPPAAPPPAVLHLPGETLRARSTAWRKKMDESKWGSQWSWNEASDPKHKLSMWCVWMTLRR